MWTESSQVPDFWDLLDALRQQQESQKQGQMTEKEQQQWTQSVSVILNSTQEMAQHLRMATSNQPDK